MLPSIKVMNIILSFILFVFWIWGILITIKYWGELPTWAKVLAILGIILYGGPFTVIVVYIGRSVNIQPS